MSDGAVPVPSKTGIKVIRALSRLQDLGAHPIQIDLAGVADILRIQETYMRCAKAASELPDRAGFNDGMTLHSSCRAHSRACGRCRPGHDGGVMQPKHAGSS